MYTSACHNNFYNFYKWYLCCACRLIWLVIILFACAYFSYLVTFMFIHWMSHPKNVNVDFKFNASLPFPAVTICNESPYR